MKKLIALLSVLLLFTGAATAFNPVDAAGEFWQDLTGEEIEPEVNHDVQIPIDTGFVFSFAGEAPSPDATAENPRCYDNSFYVDTDGDVGVEYFEKDDKYYYGGYDTSYALAEICGGRYNYQCDWSGQCDGYVEDGGGSDDDSSSDDGGSDDVTNDVEADAEIDVPQNADIEEKVTFSGEDSIGEGGVDSYQWIVNGDSVGSGSTLEFTFSEAGTYDVELEIEAGDGDTDSASESVSVKAEPPQPVASVPETSEAGETFYLDASATQAGSYGISEYIWEVGDKTLKGSTVETSLDSAGSTDIELKVTDEQGNSKTISNTIEVTGTGEESSGNFFEQIIGFFQSLF